MDYHNKKKISTNYTFNDAVCRISIAIGLYRFEVRLLLSVVQLCQTIDNKLPHTHRRVKSIKKVPQNRCVCNTLCI